MQKINQDKTRTHVFLLPYSFTNPVSCYEEIRYQITNQQIRKSNIKLLHKIPTTKICLHFIDKVKQINKYIAMRKDESHFVEP